MASMWATGPLKSKEISPSAASRRTSPTVPHLQKPWTGKQYIMEEGKMESSQNIHQGLLYRNCEHPSLCRLCCGASAVAQIKKARSSPFFPFTRLAFLTARRARICCCWRPCQRTLNICVCLCMCVNACVHGCGEEHVTLLPSLPSFQPWPGVYALTWLSSCVFPHMIDTLTF